MSGLGMTTFIYHRFGWFWECPNGGEKCPYRHALPPGFVLKSQRKALDDAAKANQISLEEFLEVEVRTKSGCVSSVYVTEFDFFSDTNLAQT